MANSVVRDAQTFKRHLGERLHLQASDSNSIVLDLQTFKLHPGKGATDAKFRSLGTTSIAATPRLTRTPLVIRWQTP